MQGESERSIRSIRRYGRHTLAFATIVLSSLLSACGLLQKVGILSAPAELPPAIEVPVPLSEQPYELKLTLTADEDVNPDSFSRPSPIQVRVFLTEKQSEIADEPFEVVFDIAGNPIDPRPVTTVTMRPGQTRELVLPANKTQTLLAIAAAYRDPYQSIWMAAAVVTPQDTVLARASLGAESVTIHSSP